MGLIQFLCLISMFVVNEKMSVVVLLTITAMAEAFVNVVADAIMCVQARKDPEYGTQNLIAYSWMATGVGGLLGCLIGGVMTQFCHPRWSFLLYSVFGLIVAVNGSYLTLESEEDPVPLDESFDSQASQSSLEEQSFFTKLSKNIKQIMSALRMPEIYMVISFFIINGLMSPDFSDFNYYFLLNVVKLSKFQYSMLGVVG